ncbi:N-acetyltransferase [Penicillium hetheringtonii]|uniref:N-acetyltransferase n=1 Tax=Penicillium hetheringtonii TaxID=911720 RepID=A0AAD6GQ97_9EURO|nr:N-acetyltransferase [Penicillium hetheringtonii]
MYLNAETALLSSKVLLVPYSSWHVPRYHEWMQDEEIQQATASEPLSMEEEYAMQQSWRQDPDKLTFIICQLTSSETNEGPAQTLTKESDSSGNMIGDINLFIRIDDGEDGSSTPQFVGEIELMIAEKRNQGQGFGKAALILFMKFIIEHCNEVLEEFASRGIDQLMGLKLKDTKAVLKFECLSVKIGQSNLRSLALFEGLGFVKVSTDPNFFGEFELRRNDLSVERIVRDLRDACLEDYGKVSYTRNE